MTISLKTHKMLWGRAAQRCAFPDCRTDLVVNAGETSNDSIVGESCHIVAREANGPRGDSSLIIEARDDYGNLILLCNIHHKVVDDAPDVYTVEYLQTMKSEHERWVKESLHEFDAGKQSDGEAYAGYIAEWANRADIDNWQTWTSRALSNGQPRLLVVDHQRLQDLAEWLYSRLWPQAYVEVEAAFQNFGQVLADFLKVFCEHADLDYPESETLWTQKFYHIDRWDRALYDELLHKYVTHVCLVEDLMLELTRAANYLCDQVRQFIDPSFRLEEGVLLVQSGPHFDDFGFRVHRVEYRGHERVKHPYPGLEQFKTIRKSRDCSFDESDDYVPLKG